MELSSKVSNKMDMNCVLQAEVCCNSQFLVEMPSDSTFPL